MTILYIDAWPTVHQRQLRLQVECERLYIVHLIVHSKSLHRGITLSVMANSFFTFDEAILQSIKSLIKMVGLTAWEY